ncbi:MAG TPA: tetratricopeptide repeat protein [Candidatus Dormibacteraeota bacterium]|nr:tetratricopeptide repeat protein [Candidatus Dormibacteraeota bacterium]
MRCSSVLLLIFTVLAGTADGKFAVFETAKVPVDRVLANLQQRLAKNTNDFEATYYLARVYSMAYSTNLVELPVRKKDDLPQFRFPGSDAGVPEVVQSFARPAARQAALAHLTNAILLYERALVLLKKSTNVAERTWMVLPTQLGLAWCLDQAGRTNDALTLYRKTLKVAWKQEVTGDFDFQQWARDAWGDVRSGQNPIRTHNRGFIGPGVCFSEETIGYLLKLLDPVKDAQEIARLKQDQKTLASLGRAISPILIPLEAGSFNELVNENAAVEFDLDGSGLKRKWGWLTPKAGWLVYAPGTTGTIDSALQMFGNVTFWVFWSDGYTALSSLDDNDDGVLSGPELHGLAIWNDRNGNGISEPGEVTTVEDLGIGSILCRSEIDGRGMHWNPAGIVFTNGSSRATYDWLVPSNVKSFDAPEKPD